MPKIAVQNLDYLGLVAGLIDEIGIVDKINQLVGEKPGEIVSRSHVIKAMMSAYLLASLHADVLNPREHSPKEDISKSVLKKFSTHDWWDEDQG